MKLVIIFAPHAVGKMTVGQECGYRRNLLNEFFRIM
jgi:hypothetical protein